MSKRKSQPLAKSKMEDTVDNLNLESSDFESDDSISNPCWITDSELSEGDDSEDVFSELEVGDRGTSDEEEVECAEENEDGEGTKMTEDELRGSATKPAWQEYTGNHKKFLFTGRNGIQQHIPRSSSPLDIFKLFIDDEVIDHIVTETNRCGQKCAHFIGPKREHCRVTKWTKTNSKEMKKLFGLLLWMDLVRLESLQAYWSSNGIYKQELPRSVMSRNRFQSLLTMLHFADNTNPNTRLAKIQPLLDILIRKFKTIYFPGENIVIEETLIPWRGRTKRQYIPNKVHKHGLRLFKLCDTNGYTWDVNLHAGKETEGGGRGERSSKDGALATKVCLSLTDGLLDEGRTLFVDNFCTSYELAVKFLERETHFVGTITASRKNMPKEIFTEKLKRGVVNALEDKNGIVILKWKDTHHIKLLTTKPIVIPVTRERTTPFISNLALTLRKKLKWYKKLGIELILGLALVNAYIIYKLVTKKKVQIGVFREELAAELLLSNNGSQQSQRSPLSKRQKKVNHLLILRKSPDGKKIRRKCTNCYAKLREKEGREQARKRAKTSYTYCNTCEGLPQLCLDCFNLLHQ